MANTTEITTPTITCFNTIESILLYPLPDINPNIITVSIYAHGSLLPLSSSNIEAIDPLKFNFCDLNIANTDAASVDPTIEPISNPSNNVVLKTIGGHHVIEKLTKSEKCYLYFDLAPTISIDEILAKYIKDDSRSGQLNGKFEESTPNTVYSKTDDDGRSYSFAGKDPNNWVKIGNQYFRIIRFNGRGGMKLIFSGSGAPEVSGEGTGIGVSKFNDLGNDSFTNLDMSYVGLQYTNNALHGNSKNSTVLGASNSEDTKTLYGWLNVKIKPNYESIIDSNAGFCSDRTSSGSFQTYFFPAYYNFFPNEKGITTPTPSLVCQDSSDLLKLPVGLITVDEYVLAGGLPYISTDSANYYNTSFWLHTGKTYWTMTPRYHLKGISYVFFIYSVGYFSLANGYSVNSSLSVRPVINIKSSTKFVAGGTGTADNPYVVSVN